MPVPLRIAVILLVVAALGYIFFASFHTAVYHVEVCVRYNGGDACREAAGRTHAEALRGAHDNACAQLTSGVTGTIGCQNTPAYKVVDLSH